MRLGCWEDNGKPWLVTEAVKRWAPVFGDSDHFGPLHIVVEDWNLDEESIKYCLAQTKDETEASLCRALLSMSEDERWTAAILGDYPDFKPK